MLKIILAVLLVVLLLFGGLVVLLFFIGGKTTKPKTRTHEPESPETEEDLGWLSSLLEGYELPTDLPSDEKKALLEAKQRFRQKGALFVRESVGETLSQIGDLLTKGPRRLIPQRLERLGELVLSERERWTDAKEKHIRNLTGKQLPQEEPDLMIHSILKEETGEELGGSGLIIRTGWASIEVTMGALAELENIAHILEQDDKEPEEIAEEIGDYYDRWVN